MSNSDLDPLADNKLLIVKLGGLGPLIRLMSSPKIEVQINVAACITNLSAHGMPWTHVMPIARLIVYR